MFYSLRTSVPLVTDPPLPLDRVEGLVLDKVVVSNPADKEQLIEATQQALTRQSVSYLSHCFNPRHAVSTADGQTVVLLCFECGQAKIITPYGNRMVPINRSAKSLLDDLVRKYQLKSEKSPDFSP